MKKEVANEVLDILFLYEALEKAVPSARFPGFDVEGEDASAMPYEGHHHAAAEKYRGLMRDRMTPWPNESHKRNLTRFRKMVSMWKKIGTPKELAVAQANEILAVP